MENIKDIKALVNSVGVERAIDSMGRISIPVDFRKALELPIGAQVKMLRVDDIIVLVNADK